MVNFHYDLFQSNNSWYCVFLIQENELNAINYAGVIIKDEPIIVMHLSIYKTTGLERLKELENRLIDRRQMKSYTVIGEKYYVYGIPKVRDKIRYLRALQTII